jgi:hypothetical protein
MLSLTLTSHPFRDCEVTTACPTSPPIVRSTFRKNKRGCKKEESYNYLWIRCNDEDDGDDDIGGSGFIQK